MKLSEIKNFIKLNNFEKEYNSSLNYNKINSPINTFYSSEKIKCFENSLENIDNLNYINYYKYLTKEFNPDCGFVKYLEKKAEDWILKYPKIEKNKAIVYLLKMFIINPIDGRLKEISVKKKIKERFPNFNVIEPNGKQDTDECWDLKIENKFTYFCMQVKPYSFFNSLNSTSQYSFLKIKNASENYNNPIFLVSEKNGTIDIYIRDLENKNNCSFVSLNDFKIENLKQEEINLLSRKTFENINRNINKIKLNKNKF